MVVHQANQSDLLAVTMEDASVLDAAYMPFIIDGGLFIPTAKRYRLVDILKNHLLLYPR